MSKSKAKGTWAESALREYFRESGWPEAARKTLTGSKDEGDLFIHKDFAIEVKNVAKRDYPGWMRETEEERANSKSEFGVLIVKPNGFGERRIGLWYAVILHSQFNKLLSKCYPPLKYLPTPAIEKWSAAQLDLWLASEERLAKLNGDDIYRCLWRPRGYTQEDDSGYFCAVHLNAFLRILYAAGYRPEPKVPNGLS